MGDQSMEPPEAGYRRLVENVPNGVLVLFDADFRYRIVGPSTLPFSGRSATDLIGRTIHELFPEKTVSRLEPVFERTIAGRAGSIDIHYEDRVHHLETTPVEIDSEPYGVLLTQDVTEARGTTEALRERNERLDQFASTVSHDLRTPLSVATANLDLFRETGDQSHLDSIESALERIDELSSDLLLLARSEVSSAEHEPLPLDDLAREIWSTIDTRAALLEARPVTVSGSSSQLQLLLENLFRNAVGHGGDEVTVRIGPIEDGGFFIEDTGTGIPEEIRERVFEHGFTTGYGGSGVGLTIVARIAEAHDLDVHLSESDEGGARFEFQRMIPDEA